MPQQTPQVPEQSGRMAAGACDLPGLTPERFEVPHVTDVDEHGPSRGRRRQSWRAR
jgi:hypothetical protein